VLGLLLETSLRRSLLLFEGNPLGYFTRPISGVLLAVFLLVALFPLIRSIRTRTRADAVDRHSETHQ
jgi:putative tricarboxylic transport membrane protein